MSKERDLLKEIIRYFAEGGLAIIASNSDVGETLHDAKELLAQPEQTEQTPDYYLWFDEVHEEHPTNEGDDDVMPLYTSPPKREPLSDEQIEDIYEGHSFTIHAFARAIDERSFIKGVKFAEKAHGIGVDNE